MSLRVLPAPAGSIYLLFHPERESPVDTVLAGEFAEQDKRVGGVVMGGTAMVRRIGTPLRPKMGLPATAANRRCNKGARMPLSLGTSCTCE